MQEVHVAFVLLGQVHARELEYKKSLRYLEAGVVLGPPSDLVTLFTIEDRVVYLQEVCRLTLDLLADYGQLAFL